MVSLLFLATLAAVIATFEFKPMNSTKPCNDFYESVCGDWIHQNDIPDEHGRWSKLHQTTRQIANEIE
ncbi:endothelin-converting protein 1, partial [Aphelenchoides avenae]